MDDDLISRNTLLDEIKHFSMRITGTANTMATAIMNETKKSIEKMISEQPAAYDADKVIEQLEEKLNITNTQLEIAKDFEDKKAWQ